MATIEQAISTRLTGFAGLSALVASRVYRPHLPQGATLPAVSFFRVSTERSAKMGVDSPLLRGRWQFDVWGDQAGGHDAVAAVRVQVRRALQRWRNASSPVVQDSLILDEQDLVEEVGDGTVRFHLTLDAEIWWQE